MIYDLAVVGSGSMGAAGAFFAARSVLPVTMIDAVTPPHMKGSHYGNV